MHKKKRLCRKKIFFHNSTVSFCVNYIILITQNIYFFNSHNIYFICTKKIDYVEKKFFFMIRQCRFVLII